MNMIDEIIRKLSAKFGDVEVRMGSGETDMNQLQVRLGVKFPQDYKYFLERYGYFSSDGPDVLGVDCDPDLEEYYSMVYYTEEDRKIQLPKFFRPRPKHAVIVGAYGGGGHFFLYCDDSDKSGRVELLLDELSGAPDDRFWNSFTDFIAHYAE